jgi:hypothetical protein
MLQIDVKNQTPGHAARHLAIPPGRTRQTDAVVSTSPDVQRNRLAGVLQNRDRLIPLMCAAHEHLAAVLIKFTTVFLSKLVSEFS